MGADQLRHPVKIMRRTVATDATYGGDSTVTWVKLEDVRAEIVPLSGTELIEARQVHGKVTHRLRIRYHSEITNEHRIQFGTRNFDIISVLNEEERRRFMTLLCVEVL